MKVLTEGTNRLDTVVWEVLGSNLGWQTSFSDWCFAYIFTIPLVLYWDMSLKSFPIHRSSVTLQSGTIQQITNNKLLRAIERICIALLYSFITSVFTSFIDLKPAGQLCNKTFMELYLYIIHLQETMQET